MIAKTANGQQLSPITFLRLVGGASSAANRLAGYIGAGMRPASCVNLCGMGLPDGTILPMVKSVLRTPKEKGQELLEYYAIFGLHLDPHSL
jgi:hypothetical protein